jgi:hypothetical protein
MELLGDVAHLESCIGPFGDGVSVGARLVHGLCQMYHRLRNHFGRIQSYKIGDEAQKSTRSSFSVCLVHGLR